MYVISYLILYTKMALPLASMGSAFGGNYVLIGSVVNKTYFLYDVSGMHRVLTPPYGLLFTPTPFCTPLYQYNIT